MQPLDPLVLPLHGLALIEASAGTGKTYTISTLVLRLLLQRRLPVDQILVVTFTKAATEELRDRIRRRIAEALERLAADSPAQVQEDPVLAALLGALPDPQAARTALADALTRMDEAAIHTIHGFCQRMLQDNAFESGTAFEVEFITDEARLRERAIADFWRIRLAGAELDEAARLRERWRTPADLLADLDATLAIDDLTLLPEPGAAEALRDELAEVFAAYRATWQAHGGEVREILEKDKAINRRSYSKSIVPRVLDLAGEIAGLDQPPEALGKDFERLTPAMLAEKGTKPGQATPGHPLFDLAGRLWALVPGLARAEIGCFLVAAREHLRRALARRKADEGLLYFDDLLRRLDQALAPGSGGHERLAEVIRRRYPVALIDEFQDTDPQQYRIFRRVYAGRPDCGLFLIGDPKQAIYAFRGADIFTYMQARDDSAGDGSQYTLDINWRSGSRLINALNTLFGRAERPFVYDAHIGYHDVSPSPRADEKRLLIDGAEPPALRLLMLRLSMDNQSKRPPGFIRRDAALEEAAEACAEIVAGLLIRADAGKATLGGEPLRPGDIALLVRTHREGAVVQQALRRHAITSVTLSQDSVLDSEDADELTSLLAALAALHDEGLVRAALATALLGRAAGEIDALAADEAGWESLLARFQGYRERWQAQGFLVAMQSLLQAEGIPARLLRRPDGERRLTNLLQLLELLQLASREHPGLDGLLRWLADQRAGGVHDEARALRLESDEGLVKVVTMHKSKGLEYPVVLVPFPWSFFAPRNPPPPFFHDPASRRACLDLGSAQLEAHRELESIEHLAERLRLFYVAVTRAAKQCVLCWGKVSGAEGSALAYLVHPDPHAETPGSRMRGLGEDEIRADLDALAARAPGCIAVADCPPPAGIRWSGPASDLGRLAPAHFGGRIDAAWRVSSYSALVRGAETEQPDHDAVAPGEPPDGVDAAEDRVFDLPGGIQAGHLLHEVLEQIDFPSARGEALERVVRAALDRYGQLRGPGRAAAQTDWAPVVIDLVTRVLDTPLDAAGSPMLREISASDRLAELEFHFPVAGLAPRALRAVLDGHPQYAPSAAGLGFEPLRGLMRGFIDLVFRHRERYFIVDYKSNLLGRRLSAYGTAGMAAAIGEHRYDLQYLIYTLALHRFLGARLPGYDYERHFGGVYYLFLRGMRPAEGPAHGVWHDRPSPGLVARLDRLFAGKAIAGNGEAA